MDRRRCSVWSPLLVVVASGCGQSDEQTVDTDPAGTTTTADSTSGSPTTSSTSPSSASTGPVDDTGSSMDESDGSSGDTDEDDPGPDVDLSDPQLYEFEFTPDEADPEASTHLSPQLAYLDTNVTPLGRLVVYLHGAGTPSTCGSRDHGRVLAQMGFHVVSPCYVSDYGVGNCGNDIGGCRLEAFEGVDHHPFIDIAPPDSIETRVVRMLEHLQSQHPGGDWQYFVADDTPRWNKIVISGISHGASTSGVIGMHRVVDRVVMLSGPLDTGQSWLLGQPLTPIDRFWGFTHTDDGQHQGHLLAFEDLLLPGEPSVVDAMAPPYGGSHRLVTSAQSSNGHGAPQAGGASPQDEGQWLYLPVWALMYGASE